MLRQAVGRDRENPFAWTQLATIYERKGDQPRVALAMAERASLIGEPQMALASARAAVAGLPEGSSERLRAQDIQMIAQNELDERKHNRRRLTAQ